MFMAGCSQCLLRSSSLEQVTAHHDINQCICPLPSLSQLSRHTMQCQCAAASVCTWILCLEPVGAAFPQHHKLQCRSARNDLASHLEQMLRPDSLGRGHDWEDRQGEHGGADGLCHPHAVSCVHKKGTYPWPSGAKSEADGARHCISLTWKHSSQVRDV